jgi:demethylmenaquinone methyltransferase/2-methoxy-6-polyprenyl-1,4-benzoquinol methylase
MTGLIEYTITPREARRFYDRLGARHDVADLIESRAKRRGLEVLHLTPGQSAANIGVGNGLEYLEMLARVGPEGFVAGLDLSPVMVHVSRQRALTRGEPQPALALGNALQLPYAANSFDRLFSSYMLDLIPAGEIPAVLSEFRRVLRPGGRLALVGLTEGEGPISEGIMSIWKGLYRVQPAWLGGCRPVRLRDFVREAGFTFVQRWYVSQWGYPSEIVSAVKPTPGE